MGVLGEQTRGVRVAQVVKASTSQAGLLEELVKGCENGGFAKRPAERVTEDQIERLPPFVLKTFLEVLSLFVGS